MIMLTSKKKKTQLTHIIVEGNKMPIYRGLEYCICILNLK